MDGPRPPDRTGHRPAAHRIVDVYTEAGHEVVLVDPVEGLPDMVFTANAGLVLDGRALVSRFRHPERAGKEQTAFRRFFEQLGLAEVAVASAVNEGEGDYLPVGSVILGGSGFRTDPRSHDEVSEFFSRPVIPLELVDERFYHLDTALTVLDEDQVAYWPGAFSPASQGRLGELFPDAVLATDAMPAFFPNACSDGTRVVMSATARRLAAAFRERGFTPIPVPTSELQKAGGSAKGCTLELLMLSAPTAPVDLERVWSAHNYDPLPVTLVSGRGGLGDRARRHPLPRPALGVLGLELRPSPPSLVAAAHAPARPADPDQPGLSTNDQLGPFCAELAQLVGMDGVLVMNTGAEAVETAIKAVRRWAYDVKGVAAPTGPRS